MEEDGKESVAPPAGAWAGKNRYKTGGLTVILCLAVWSVLSGSAGIAVRWSVGMYPFSDRLADPRMDALASLLMNEVEDRREGRIPRGGKREAAGLAGWELAARAEVVRWVWDKYLKDPHIRISRFWHECFDAAFEELESDDEAVKNSAFQEIARLTVDVFELDEGSEKPNPRILTAEADPASSLPLWKR